MATSMTKAELERTLDAVAGLALEALDPELTREEVVAKVKLIAGFVGVGEEENGEDEEAGELDEED